MRILERQGPEEEAVDHAELKCRETDAEGKSQRGRHDHKGALAQHTRTIASILQQSLQPRYPTAIPADLLCGLDTPQREERVPTRLFDGCA